MVFRWILPISAGELPEQTMIPVLSLLVWSLFPAAVLSLDVDNISSWTESVLMRLALLWLAVTLTEQQKGVWGERVTCSAVGHTRTGGQTMATS